MDLIVKSANSCKCVVAKTLSKNVEGKGGSELKIFSGDRYDIPPPELK